MGTNFYFMSKDKELVQNNFAIKESWGIHSEEYEIVDEPYLGYEIHLNKLSIGWRPLFQRHKAFKTFKELEKFYFDNKDNLDIYDEYGDKYVWDEYFDRVYIHSLREREPRKWIYEIDNIFNDSRPTLHTVSCDEKEAELFIPFDHVIYAKTEKEAMKRYRLFNRFDIEVKYWNDPDYFFDWTEGKFS